jgi:endonuclease YncB( thermonuclease family)
MKTLQKKSSFKLTRGLLAATVVLTSIGLFAFSGSAAAQGAGQYALTGKVVQVSDGDTINLLVDKTQHRIRLASIDAPETSHGSERPGQPFGEASRKNLADYVAGKTLTLTCYEKDHYGRDVCDVPANGTTANRLQVQDGMAWANQQAKGKFLRDKSLVGIQSDAQKKKLGLWAEPGAVAPWEWRVVCWQNKKCK